MESSHRATEAAGGEEARAGPARLADEESLEEQEALYGEGIPVYALDLWSRDLMELQFPHGRG